MSLLKSFGSIVGGAVKGFVHGGPTGALAGGLQSVTGGRRTSPVDSTITRTSVTPFGFSREQKIYTTPFPGPGGGYDNLPSGVTQLPALMSACPVGYRLNKSTYITRGGGTSRWGPAGSIALHPKGTTCVKRRRRNVGNARALRRAISRVKGFVKLAHRATKLVGPRRTTRRKALPGQGTSIVNVGD